MIMPLANRRDKQTQVVWGIGDFEHRFGRKPEGMWLAETAVDVETLEVLAEHDIKFTVLAPSQAKHERRIGTTKFKNVEGGKIDPTRPYICKLPSGRSINLFFYDGPISRAVAFEGLLSNGETFANRLLSGFADNRRWPQLMHIATDGETYGHHHRQGRHGAGLRAASHRKQQPGEADQLRRVSGDQSADPRSGDRGEHGVELRPRRGPLEPRLRL